ncbi:MAG: hypothetical protein CMI36_14390 [Owenweeksia sp.]|nr:hypothetical protein [Owenweeksia sp.]
METVLERIAKNFEAKTLRHKSRNKSLRLYQRLYNLLKDSIINNDIPGDTVLPATRILADALELSRSTVNRAYELLRLEGYIDSYKGSGHVVRQIHQDILPPKKEGREEGRYPELSETGQSFLKNVSLINSTDDKSIAFRPGLPPLDIFPVKDWKNLSNRYWRYIKSSALSYSPSSGIDQLKRNIANYINLSRNIKCDPRQIFIVSGSLQSLYLVGNTVLNPGDSVIMENPTFPNVHSIFRSLRANIQAVGIDEQGLSLEQLRTLKPDRTKLLHCTPSCHYPSGVRMSVERRKALLEWASENETFIIENDYEHEVHNYRDQSPSLFSLDKEERVIYLSTFNRLLHPSIRLGYMVVPLYLLDAVEALLKHSHRFVPPSVQVVMNQFIEKHHLHNHVKKVIEVAEEREQLFVKTFEEAFQGKVRLHHNTIRSLHILAEIPPGRDDRDVVNAFARHNIIVHSYSKCFTSEPKKQGFIMGYSSVRAPIIRKKVQQMARLYHSSFS